MAGGFRHVPQGTDALVQRIRNLEKGVASIGSKLAGLGIKIDGASGDLIFDEGTGVLRSGDFDGDVHTPAAGTAGWGLGGADGNAVFNTLVLRAGIIGNDALTSPVVPHVQHDFSDTFTVPHALTTVLTSAAITVPAGFTQALVTSVAAFCAINSSAGSDYADVFVGINGSYSHGVFTAQVASGLVTTGANSNAALLTGLTGGSTFTTTVQANANGATTWAAVGSNACRMSTTVLFLR